MLTSNFIGQNIKKTCMQELRFNKINSFTALSMTFTSETGNFGCKGLTGKNTSITTAVWSYGLNSQ